MKTKTLFFSLYLLICFGAFCQQKSYIYFDSIYDCTNNKQGVGFSVQETDYGYIVAGGSSLTYEVIFIQKTDKQGNSMGVKIYERLGCHLWAGAEGSLIKTNDGGYALGGGVSSSLNNKAMLVKFDGNGDTLWTKEYGDNISGSTHMGRQCKQTKDKGYIIVGEKQISTYDEDVLIIKTDSMGNQQWQKTYGGANIDVGWSIAVTPDSGFIIGGYTRIGGTNYSRNALVIKTDSMGNLQWQKVFGGAFDDGLAVVAVAKDSNLFVMFNYAFSQPYPTEPAYSKLNVIKLDTSGDVIWNKIIGPLRFVYGMCGFYELLNGNIVCAGYYLPALGVGLSTIFMLNSIGDSVWMRDYKRVVIDGTNALYNIQQTSDNGFIACGVVGSGVEPPYGQNMWLLKMDSVGCLEPNCDEVNIVEPMVKESNYGLKVFPNPAQDYFTIEYKLSETAGNAVIEIVDLTGKKLRVLPIYDKQNQLILETNELQTGIYYIRLLVDGATSNIQKISVIK